MKEFKRDNIRNYWIIVVILGIASLAMVRLEFSSVGTYTATHINRFPRLIGEWEGKDISIDKHVIDILGTKDVILRRYRDKDGDSLILTIVYSASRRDSFHPPEYCYLGGGAKLANKLKESIDLKEGSRLVTNKLVLNYPGGLIRAWYWYAVGDTFTDSYYLQQAHLALNALRGIKKGGALIRVSTENINSSSEKKAKEFIRLALPLLKQIL